MRLEQQRHRPAGIGSGGGGAVEVADEVAVGVARGVVGQPHREEGVVAAMGAHLVGGDHRRIKLAELPGWCRDPQIGPDRVRSWARSPKALKPPTTIR